jgi:CBS domain-containing protein
MCRIKVQEILEEKGHECYTVSPETNAMEALNLMAEKNVGA